VLLQLLADICHVSDSEWEQEERSSYISHCDVSVDDEDREDERDVVHDPMKIEEAQLMGGEDVEDTNKMLITSSEFTDLPTLSSLDNANFLMQVHNHICQSLNEAFNAEQDTLDRTIYKLQFNQEQEFYISVCHGSILLLLCFN